MLLNPDFGLVFWTTITFLLLVFLLGKFAWKPIMQSIEKRNQEIANALANAEKMKQEIALLEAEHEKMIQEARLERDRIINEARKVSEKIINDAHEKAKEEAQRILENAYETIENQKIAMMTDLRNDVALIALEIAEEVIREHFKDNEKQRQYAFQLAEKFKMN
ncbi:MAG: F0F1 ATP synthase subunit B [Bacteroidales bacterium]|nr:F0F1 ATP synthase subunit B [Bacteroidales bacterium]